MTTATRTASAVPQWLFEDLRHVFRRDRRVRVLLWFDHRRDFVRVLEGAGDFLARHGMSLLTLDGYDGRGALWAKWSIEVGEHRDAHRAVLWIPGSYEDFADGVLENGLRVACLREYLCSGAVWRIDGHPPTLFRFLKSHGVKFPERRSDYDPIIRDGSDSLLAKYVQSNLHEDDDFWTQDVLTAAQVENDLIGNLDETLFALLADPTGEMHRVTDRGVTEELLSQLRSRFGTVAGLVEDPEAWARQFVKRLVALDVYEATGTAEDFPYGALLPDEGCWPEYRDLHRRWMRDAQHNETYRRWAYEIDDEMRLVDYARNKAGTSDALPTLARTRWDRFMEGLRDRGESEEGLRSFLENQQATVQEETQGFWTSVENLGWHLAGALIDLVDRSNAAQAEARELVTAGQFVEAHAETWFEIDGLHAAIVRDSAEVNGSEPLVAWADRLYADLLTEINQRFYSKLEDQVWPPEGVCPVSDLSTRIFAEPRARAILVVDAFRYDLAVTLRDRLRDGKVAPVVANLPSVTYIGMTSLIPEPGANMTIDGRNVTLESAAGDLALKANRIGLMNQKGSGDLRLGGSVATEMNDVLAAFSPPDDTPDLVVLFDSGLDDVGHDRGHGVLRLTDELLSRLVRAIRKLQDWGYTDIHVVTDHGFVVLRSDARIPKMSVDINNFSERHRQSRYGYVGAPGDVDVKVFPVALDPSKLVAVPPGVRSFTSPGQFFHGGATLQEIVIPHLHIQSRGKTRRTAEVTVEAPSETATLTVKITLRTTPPEDLQIFDEFEALDLQVFLGSDPSDAKSNIKDMSLRSDAEDEATVTIFLNREPPTPEGTEIPLTVLNKVTGETYAAGRTIRAARDLS